jgi:hypothetical protein
MTGHRKILLALAVLAVGALLAWAGKLDATGASFLAGLVGLYGAANVAAKGKRK